MWADSASPPPSSNIQEPRFFRVKWIFRWFYAFLESIFLVWKWCWKVIIITILFFFWTLPLFVSPGGEYWEQFLSSSPIPEYQTLSKRLKVPNYWPEFYNLIEHGVIGNGTQAYKSFGLTRWMKSLGRWWKGNLVLGDYPYAGYLSDKKWHLNEASDIFSFIFCCEIFKKFETSIFFRV